MSEGFQLSSDPTVERLVGLNQILPSQYFDVSGGHRLTGEQRLMLALLADAINVYQQGVASRNTRKRMLFVDAERWITGSSKCHHAFTFDTVCDALGINPDMLRRRMRTWKYELRRNLGPQPSPTHPPPPHPTHTNHTPPPTHHLNTSSPPHTISAARRSAMPPNIARSAEFD